MPRKFYRNQGNTQERIHWVTALTNVPQTIETTAHKPKEIIIDNQVAAIVYLKGYDEHEPTVGGTGNSVPKIVLPIPVSTELPIRFRDGLKQIFQTAQAWIATATKDEAALQAVAGGTVDVYFVEEADE